MISSTSFSGSLSSKFKSNDFQLVPLQTKISVSALNSGSKCSQVSLSHLYCFLKDMKSRMSSGFSSTITYGTFLFVFLQSGRTKIRLLRLITQSKAPLVSLKKSALSAKFPTKVTAASVLYSEISSKFSQEYACNCLSAAITLGSLIVAGLSSRRFVRIQSFKRLTSIFNCCSEVSANGEFKQNQLSLSSLL